MCYIYARVTWSGCHQHDRQIIFIKTSASTMYSQPHFNSLMQERHNSIVNALELRLSCTNLLIWFDACVCHQVRCMHWVQHNIFNSRDPVGTSPWWPLLGILSWYPLCHVKSLQLISRSGTRRFYLRVPDLEMRCSSLTEWVCTSTVISVMAGRVTCPVIVVNLFQLLKVRRIKKK